MVSFPYPLQYHHEIPSPLVQVQFHKHYVITLRSRYSLQLIKGSLWSNQFFLYTFLIGRTWNSSFFCLEVLRSYSGEIRGLRFNNVNYSLCSLHFQSCTSIFVFDDILYSWQNMIKLCSPFSMLSFRILGFPSLIESFSCSRPVFLYRRAAARYRALASITQSRERPEETTICYNISLVQLVTNLNVILYLSTCHNVYISVLILFMIML